MASGGPKVQISQTDIQKFQGIIKASAADRKVLMGNLDASEKLRFALYVKMLQSKEKVSRTGAEVDALDAREAALRAEDRTILHQASSSYAPKVSAPISGSSVPKSDAAKFKY